MLILRIGMLSSVSSYFGQTEPMQFTPHMEGYLRNLEQSSECPTDKMFASQIRLQLLAQNIAQVQSRHGEHNYHNTESLAGPESFYLHTAQAQLQSLRTSLDPHLLREGELHLLLLVLFTGPRTTDGIAFIPDILSAHIHYVELTILETFCPITSSHTAVPSLKRAQSAWQSLEAVKSFFEVFFARSSASPASCAGISFTFWAQLSKSLVVLFRLSTMSDWNRDEVGKTVDLLAVLDRLVGTMDHASLEAGEQSPDDLYAQFARLLRTFEQRLGEKRAGGRARVAGDPQQPTWVGSAPRGGETIFNDLLDITMMQATDFENEEWFQDFFAQT